VAALIGPNIAVTTASCFCSYGGAVEFSAANFKSAPFDGGSYFQAEVSGAFPSTFYCSGTDTCTVSGSRRKCANDIAVVSLLNINQPQGLVGLAPGVVSPYYSLGTCSYSFVSNNGFTTGPAAQITALGYAMNLNDGARMMRTDSLGQLQTPNQLYIGSTMRAGSTGSPMLVNFGNPMSNSNPLGSDSNPNTMVGVISWYSAQASAGANDYTVGGSCFATNSQYTQYTNVVTLVNSYCCTLNLEQRAAQCDGRYRPPRADKGDPLTCHDSLTRATPFTHSFTHSLIHSFTHSLIHSFTHSLIHSFTHSLISSRFSRSLLFARRANVPGRPGAAAAANPAARDAERLGPVGRGSQLHGNVQWPRKDVQPGSPTRRAHGQQCSHRLPVLPGSRHLVSPALQWGLR